MKAILVLFLLCALGAQHNSDEQVQGHVHVVCLEDGGQFSVAVMVPKTVNADHAVVEIGYRTHVAGIKEELFLTKVSVVNLVPEAWVGAEGVPVTKDKVARVDVTLVKDVERQRFQMIREAK